MAGEYYGAAEPPVRCGVSHLSGLTEPPVYSYSANVNHFFTLLGKMFFTPYGKEFFSYSGKQIFTS